LSKAEGDNQTNNEDQRQRENERQQSAKDWLLRALPAAAKIRSPDEAAEKNNQDEILQQRDEILSEKKPLRQARGGSQCDSRQQTRES